MKHCNFPKRNGGNLPVPCADQKRGPTNRRSAERRGTRRGEASARGSYLAEPLQDRGAKTHDALSWPARGPTASRDCAAGAGHLEAQQSVRSLGRGQGTRGEAARSSLEGAERGGAATEGPLGGSQHPMEEADVNEPLQTGCTACRWLTPTCVPYASERKTTSTE